MNWEKVAKKSSLVWCHSSSLKPAKKWLLKNVFKCESEGHVPSTSWKWNRMEIKTVSNFAPSSTAILKFIQYNFMPLVVTVLCWVDLCSTLEALHPILQAGEPFLLD
jgi:hypothetical protein